MCCPGLGVKDFKNLKMTQKWKENGVLGFSFDRLHFGGFKNQKFIFTKEVKRERPPTHRHPFSGTCHSATLHRSSDLRCSRSLVCRHSSFHHYVILSFFCSVILLFYRSVVLLIRHYVVPSFPIQSFRTSKPSLVNI